MAPGVRKNEPCLVGIPEVAFVASWHPGKLISPLYILYGTLKGKKAGAEERLATQVRNGTDFS